MTTRKQLTTSSLLNPPYKEACFSPPPPRTWIDDALVGSHAASLDRSSCCSDVRQDVAIDCVECRRCLKHPEFRVEHRNRLIPCFDEGWQTHLERKKWCVSEEQHRARFGKLPSHEQIAISSSLTSDSSTVIHTCCLLVLIDWSVYAGARGVCILKDAGYSLLYCTSRDVSVYQFSPNWVPADCGSWKYCSGEA